MQGTKDHPMPTKAPPLPPMALFALAATLPLPLFAIGLAGGAWMWLGLFYMTAFTALLDQALSWFAPEAPEGTAFPAADPLLIVLGTAHLAAMPLAVWAIEATAGWRGGSVRCCSQDSGSGAGRCPIRRRTS